MKSIEEVIERGLQGFVIGVFLIQTIGFVWILVSKSEVSIASDFYLRQYISGGTIGLVFGVLNLLYKNVKIDFVKATVIHFLGVAGTFLVMGYYANWIGKDAMTLFQALLTLLVSYLIIWMICYIGWKRDVASINKNLKRMR